MSDEIETKGNEVERHECNVPIEALAPHPTVTKAWYREPISLFTALVALFTFVLCAVAGIQTWAFIQSERAFLSPADVNFLN